MVEISKSGSRDIREGYREDTITPREGGSILTNAGHLIDPISGSWDMQSWYETFSGKRRLR